MERNKEVSQCELRTHTQTHIWRWGGLFPECLIVSKSVPECPRVGYIRTQNSYFEMKGPFPRVSRSVPECSRVGYTKTLIWRWGGLFPKCPIVSHSVPECPKVDYACTQKLIFRGEKAFPHMSRQACKNGDVKLFASFVDSHWPESSFPHNFLPSGCQCFGFPDQNVSTATCFTTKCFFF